MHRGTQRYILLVLHQNLKAKNCEATIFYYLLAFFSVKKRDKKIVKLLLQQRANPDLRNDMGKTPKDIALENCDFDTLGEPIA